MLKPEVLCYSIIWKRLAPCKFIEWNMIKKINKLLLYIMFQTTMPPSFPAFLNYNITIISCFPLEAGTLQRRGRDSGIALLCALERRGKTPLFKALISSRSQSTLQRRQSSCLFGRWATESRGWSDSFTDLWQSRALGCGSVQAGLGLVPTTWLLQGWRTQPQVMPFPGCWSLPTQQHLFWMWLHG